MGYGSLSQAVGGLKCHNVIVCIRVGDSTALNSK